MPYLDSPKAAENHTGGERQSSSSRQLAKTSGLQNLSDGKRTLFQGNRSRQERPTLFSFPLFQLVFLGFANTNGILIMYIYYACMYTVFIISIAVQIFHGIS